VSLAIVIELRVRQHSSRSNGSRPHRRGRCRGPRDNRRRRRWRVGGREETLRHGVPPAHRRVRQQVLGVSRIFDRLPLRHRGLPNVLPDDGRSDVPRVRKAGQHSVPNGVRGRLSVVDAAALLLDHGLIDDRAADDADDPPLVRNR